MISNAILADSHRRLQALEAQLTRLSGLMKRWPTPEPAPAQPHWEMIKREGGTYPAGTDWQSEFEDNSIDSRVVFKRPTTGGELISSRADDTAVFARLRFQSTGTGTVRARLTGSFNRVQLKMNGVREEHTASTWIDVPVHRGLNEVIVMSDDAEPDAHVELCADFFDGETWTWVEPEGVGR